MSTHSGVLGVSGSENYTYVELLVFFLKKCVIFLKVVIFKVKLRNRSFFGEFLVSLGVLAREVALVRAGCWTNCEDLKTILVFIVSNHKKGNALFCW